MKKLRTLMLVLFLCFACSQISVNHAASVEAATVKSGLKKENGKYYYYVKGEKVKNAWKTVKKTSGTTTVTNRYYFGSDGSAYMGTSKAPAVKKISGAYYAFDANACAYCSTTQVINNFQCTFSSTGMLTGVIKVSGKYYYYAGKTKAVNTFKKAKVVVSGKTYTYTYYFGSNGAAYTGKKNAFFGTIEPLLKKINGSYYAFNEKARMVTGVWVIDGKLYSFDSNGKYNSTKSSKLRKACVYDKDAAPLLALLGKEKKRVVLDSCMGIGEDVDIYYDHFRVSVFKDQKGKEVFLGVFAL